MNIRKLLEDLSIKRPLFHSEADFQHSLAWEIRCHHPDATIRLEYRPAVLNTRMYLDIWAVLPDETAFAIELKYKTRNFVEEVHGEPHELLNQNAQDLGRYDFLRDVVRLEQLTAADRKIRGMAVLLTNDSSYWSAAKKSETVDAAFRIHEGRALTGALAWGSGASAGTMRSRENPIELSAAYNVNWTNYSQIGTHRTGIFRYTLIEVVAGGILGTEDQPK